ARALLVLSARGAGPLSPLPPAPQAAARCRATPDAPRGGGAPDRPHAGTAAGPVAHGRAEPAAGRVHASLMGSLHPSGPDREDVSPAGREPGDGGLVSGLRLQGAAARQHAPRAGAPGALDARVAARGGRASRRMMRT